MIVKLGIEEFKETFGDGNESKKGKRGLDNNNTGKGQGWKQTSAVIRWTTLFLGSPGGGGSGGRKSSIVWGATRVTAAQAQ